MSERALWLSVIAQAITDAAAILTPAQELNRYANTPRDHKRNALAWLKLSNSNFRFVCDLAGVEPSKVIALAEQTIEQAKAQDGGALSTFQSAQRTGGGASRKIEPSQNFFAEQES